MTLGVSDIISLTLPEIRQLIERKTDISKTVFLLGLAKYTKLTDEKSRLVLIERILKEHKEEISYSSLSAAFQGAASAGNILTLTFLEEHCQGGFTDACVNDAFNLAAQEYEFRAILYLLKKYGKIITLENKKLALFKAAIYCSLIEDQARFEIIVFLCTFCLDQFAKEDIIFAFKEAAISGNIKILAYLKEILQDNILENINEIFVLPSHYIEKNLFILTHYGQSLSPLNKEKMLLQMTKLTQFLSPEIRFEIIALLLRSYKHEIEGDVKEQAWQNVAQQKDKKGVELLQAECPELFATTNLLYQFTPLPIATSAQSEVKVPQVSCQFKS